METKQSSDSPTPATTDPGSKLFRGIIGALLGWVVGGLLGWLIDRAITSDPYGGVRIGSFVGGMCGVAIGIGAGWRGIGFMLFIIVCSALGVAVSYAIWNPDPNSFADFVPSWIGGTVGAFIGLALGAVLLRSRRQENPTRTSPDSKLPLP